MAAIVLPEPGTDSSTHQEPCRVWGFWATTGFGLGAVVAWTAGQALAALVVLAWFEVGRNRSDIEADTIISLALTISVATIASMPAAIAVIVFAARRAHCRARDYLALHWPARNQLLIGVAAVAILLPLGDLSSYLTGRDIVPSVVVDAYRSARMSGHLVVLAVAVVVAAPLMEEFLFRGFLFRGYAASRLGLLGAIILTSAAWAAMHVQYEVFYISQIFILGCVFGWLRWHSGTTTLTLILHAIVNLTALLQVAYIVERAA